MTAEAAVLGTSAFRFSDFTNELSYINELENYGLVYSFKTSEHKQFIQKLQSFLEQNNHSKNESRTQQKNKIKQLISEKADPLPFFLNEIEQCLKS